MGSGELLDQLLWISDALASDMDTYLRNHGLTPAKAHLLWTLGSSGPCRQRDLAQAVGHSPRHVTTLVDELISSGYVTRQAHPTDRRAVLIKLTRKARALLDQMATGRTELAGQLFGHLTSTERSQLGQHLGDLAQRLRSLGAAGQP